jgi:ankyrin repeat protein
MRAVHSGYYSFVEKALKNGADANEKNDVNDATLVNEAAYICDAKMVELLLKYKANPNIGSSLSWAIHTDPSPSDSKKEKDRISTVELLIQHGENVLIGSRERGASLLSRCAISMDKKRFPEIFDLIMEAGKSQKRELDNKLSMFWYASKKAGYPINQDCMKKIYNLEVTLARQTPK